MTPSDPTAAERSDAANRATVTAAAARLLGLLRRRMLGARRKATTEALAPWVRVVSEGTLCGVKPGKRHWADCYRRACDYVLAHTDQRGSCPPISGMRLVHGVCGDANDLWAHAWVELPGGLVFDGVRQQFYDRDGYSEVLHAMVEATYDAPEMIEQMRESERYGPWHAGMLGRDATRRGIAPASGAGGVPAVQPA